MRTIVLTSLGVLALLLAALATAPAAQATPLAAAGDLGMAADNGSSFGYRCAPRVRRVVVRRRYVRAVPASTCAPRYVVRRSYYRPYYSRPYYYPSVRVGLGFGHGHRHGYARGRHYGHRHHGHHGRRSHGGRVIGRRR